MHDVRGDSKGNAETETILPCPLLQAIGQVSLRGRDRIRQVRALAKSGRNGRGKTTPGTTKGTIHPGTLDPVGITLASDQVIRGRVGGQMPSLDQDSASAKGDKRFSCSLDVVSRITLYASKLAGFL
tara:strand:+ start:475 stop:855 length:381 start_codon:yes stop_codon:yes gene_type:complete